MLSLWPLESALSPRLPPAWLSHSRRPSHFIASGTPVQWVAPMANTSATRASAHIATPRHGGLAHILPSIPAARQRRLLPQHTMVNLGRHPGIYSKAQAKISPGASSTNVRNSWRCLPRQCEKTSRRAGAMMRGVMSSTSGVIPGSRGACVLQAPLWGPFTAPGGRKIPSTTSKLTRGFHSTACCKSCVF